MERERITISIKKNLLNSIDGFIDGINIRNRSHAIETLTTKALNSSLTKNAVILVGGEDALKTIPIVENNLKQLAAAGFEKVYIAVGYLAEKIKNKLGDGEKFELELEYLEGGEGSGGALIPLKKDFGGTFLVFNTADNLDKIDLNKIMEFHGKHGASATVATGDLNELKGLYILEPDAFDYIPKGFSMLETDVFPKMISDGKFIVYPIM